MAAAYLADNDETTVKVEVYPTRSASQDPPATWCTEIRNLLHLLRIAFGAAFASVVLLEDPPLSRNVWMILFIISVFVLVLEWYDITRTGVPCGAVCCSWNTVQWKRAVVDYVFTILGYALGLALKLSVEYGNWIVVGTAVGIFLTIKVAIYCRQRAS